MGAERCSHPAGGSRAGIRLATSWFCRKRSEAEKNSVSLQAEDSGDEGGFLSVPYALPLAPGEFVRVVRTELDREALAGMGIDIETADGAEVPADVLLGEDGLPRGVRVLPDNGFLNLE